MYILFNVKILAKNGWEKLQLEAALRADDCPRDWEYDLNYLWLDPRNRQGILKAG